jgi:hypothetical protein
MTPYLAVLVEHLMEAGARPRSTQMIEKIGGRDRDRTCDPLLAKQGKTPKALSGVLHQNAAIDSGTATNR